MRSQYLGNKIFNSASRDVLQAVSFCYTMKQGINSENSNKLYQQYMDPSD